MDSLDIFEESKLDVITINKDLPHSKINNYSYLELFNINKEYNKQLSEIIEKLILEKKPLILHKNDMKVVNNLLEENYTYLLDLLPNNIYTIEFDYLYLKTLSILNNLSQFESPNIKIYQKKQKLKFMELKFKNLQNNGTGNVYLRAESLVEDMENIQKDKILENHISLFNIAKVLFYKALIKFFLEDLELAEDYAIQSLNMLEHIDQEKNGKDIYTNQISNILDFLIELYDLKKDFNSVISCYEKAYYLNAGKYGINSTNAQNYKLKKEEYEKNLNKNKHSDEYGSNDKSNSFYYDENNNFNNKKLLKQNISTAKGTSDTFSFKIPITKNIEPMIISLYALCDDIEDKFSPELFLRNIYLDKTKLFKYYGINEHYSQQNYLLYLDDTINDILSDIFYEDNKIIIGNPIISEALINC